MSPKPRRPRCARCAPTSSASVLTLLGIVIGVASVIAMLAIGDGAKQAVIDRISAMGSNLLLVRPGAPNQRGFQNTATLVLADVQAIDREVPNVLAAIPEQSSTATLRFGGADYSSSVTGTSAKFPLARQWKVARGVFFSEEDERDYATVAVLGQTVAKALFAERRRSARPVRAGQQPDVSGDRRDGAARRIADRAGPGRRRARAVRHQPAAAVRASASCAT